MGCTFLPKTLNTIPKVNETVKIIIKDPQNPFINREYVGHVISQKEKLEFDDHYTSSRAGSSQSLTTLDKPWTKNKGVKKGDWAIYPEKDDVQLHGRGNTDIILRKKSKYDEIILRAGKYKDKGGNKKLNETNPSYITINHTKERGGETRADKKTISEELNLIKDRSHINIVSDTINLISHIPSKKVDENSKSIPKIINLDEQESVENNLHPLVYGDLFWEFVDLIEKYVINHIHPYAEKAPTEDSEESLGNLLTWIETNKGSKIEESTFLSKGVKTN
jgi:hypothetical protein